MPLRLRSAGGGSVLLSSPAAQSTDVAMEVPAYDGAKVLTDKTPGTVLQVVAQQNTTYATSYSETTSGTFVDMLNMSATITPKFASSKFLVRSVGGGLFTAGGQSAGLQLVRNGTVVWSSTRWGYTSTGAWTPINWASEFLDSPNTTSPLTYKFQFNTSGGATARIGDYQGSGTTLSGVIIMEIAA